MIILEQLFIDGAKNVAIGKWLTEQVEKADIDEQWKQEVLAWIKKTEYAYDGGHIHTDDEFIVGLLHKLQVGHAVQQAAAGLKKQNPKN